MKAIFMGRKPAASAALRFLVERGVQVVAVVAPLDAGRSGEMLFWHPQLCRTAQELGLTVVSDQDLYAALADDRHRLRTVTDLDDVDLVLSFLFWKKIRRPLIDLPKIGCFNFHPAPLPAFRGRRGYNSAILEGHREYGTSVHWVADDFDTGDLVEVRHFPIEEDETAFSLEQKTMPVLLAMFEAFVTGVMSGAVIPRTTQGPGQSATKRQVLEDARVQPSDNAETISRKVRAFWYPPYQGATVTLGGKDYSLVSEEILSELGKVLHGQHNPLDEA